MEFSRSKWRRNTTWQECFAALSATNEAILRSTFEQDLYQGVCGAAVDSGKFLGTAIFLIDNDSSWFRMAAGADPLLFIDCTIPVFF